MAISRFRPVAIAAFVVGVAAAGMAYTAPADPLRSAPDEARWVDLPGGTGIQQAVIYGDPTREGLYVVRNRFPPGVMSTPHSHSDDRIGVVLKGTWWTGTGPTMDRPHTVPVRAGGTMLHPKGEVHYDGARDEEVIVQIVGFGPTRKTPAAPGAPDFAKE